MSFILPRLRLPSSLPFNLNLKRVLKFNSTLAGTAPSITHQLILFSGKSTHQWPSHIESTSPLLNQINKRWGNNTSIIGKTLGWAVTDSSLSSSSTSSSSDSDHPDFNWDPSKTKFDLPPDTTTTTGQTIVETFQAILYPDMIHLPFPISINNLSKFEEFYMDLLERQRRRGSSSKEVQVTNGLKEEEEEEGYIDARSRANSNNSNMRVEYVDIFICTHGSRDCRCGEIGEPLYQSLLTQVRQRKIGGSFDDDYDFSNFSNYHQNHRNRGEDQEEKVKVLYYRIGRISHIGGHKWAGNAICYPSGDWFGRLSPLDATNLLEAAKSKSKSNLEISSKQNFKFKSLASSSPSELPTETEVIKVPVRPIPNSLFQNWRGRTGLSKAVQEELFNSQQQQQNQQNPQTQTIESLIKNNNLTKRRRTIGDQIGDRVPLRFRLNDNDGDADGGSGKVVVIFAFVGETVMEAAKRASLPSIEATCEGVCECATCHVYLDPSSSSSPNPPPPVEDPQDEELDQLDSAPFSKPDGRSRLSCQLIVSRELSDWTMMRVDGGEGGVIALPPH